MSSTVLPAVRIRGVAKACSRLGHGGAPTGGHGWGPRNDDLAVAAILAAHEAGLTLFDTADVYGLGHAEALLAKAMSACHGMRNTCIIATKGGVAWDPSGRTRRDGSPAYLRRAIEGSLRRLNIDCIDLYYLHWPDGDTALADSVGELTKLREEGKTRAIGACNLGPAQLQQLAWAGLSAVQVKGNLLEPLQLLEISDSARSLDVLVVSSSSLADGLLGGKIRHDRRFGPDDHRSRYPLFQPGSFERALRHVEELLLVANSLGRSPPSVALRWLLQSGLADVVLTGSTSPDHVHDNAACLGLELPREAMRRLSQAVPLERSDRLQAWRDRDCLDSGPSQGTLRESPHP